ncbi:ornithine carbamoyltransferase [Abditibacterium utsteinense]|uniref:Ornithine carbamoyltransferase n=1 Tax=Abditibacterium utsteinense TaxID=1960156 RepID=A0A2S8ST95_9BACT|nr:ornithine carbamoyltransferase [Abditibacterium utsteinense]PQV64017.1 ornithine carbamoyltransferase [Abditibacterium utsteinense]
MNHFLSINDLSRDDALFLLAEAARIKADLREDAASGMDTLRGKTLAMVFEKPSLRTRVSFDTGMFQLGGHAISLAPSEIGLGKRESIADVARVLSGMCDGIMARVFKNETVVELAEYANVPVINGLCDVEHPCQALADLLTLREEMGLDGRKIAYVGDGNNVSHSLMLLCAKIGVKFSAATPEGYAMPTQWVENAREMGEVGIFIDPREAVESADAVYTDVWTSMGQEEESAARLKVFPAYQINAELMKGAKNDAIILHCLPAHRGEEISAEMMESPRSRVFEQAENRLHAQKAVLSHLLGQDSAGDIRTPFTTDP